MRRSEPETPFDAFLSIEDAASILGVSHMTVRRMIDDGRLAPLRKFHRTLVSRSEVERVRIERAKA